MDDDNEEANGKCRNHREKGEVPYQQIDRRQDPYLQKMQQGYVC
jgi:hypothetical protein